jgi:ELWxxDGT repeat protein
METPQNWGSYALLLWVARRRYVSLAVRGGTFVLPLGGTWGINVGRSRLISNLAIAVAAATAVTVGIGAPAVADPTTDLPVVLDLQHLDSFSDSSGGSVAIASDTTTGTERVITGTEADGVTPVLIDIYLAASATPTSSDVVDQVSSGVPADETAAPSADPGALKPTVVVATTPTTMAVAWAAPGTADHFEVDLNGQQAQDGTTPDFTITGLASSVSYSVTLVASSDNQPVSTPTVTPPAIAGCASPGLVATSDLSSWYTSNGGDTDPAALIPTGLFVYTDDATSSGVVEGHRTAAFALSAAGPMSVNWQGAGAAPKLTLGVDFENSGTVTGTLSTATDGSGEYALSGDPTQAVLDSAPTDPAGNHSAALASWQAAFPDAQVLNVGYQLGPNVAGAGTIASIVAGCTTYQFATPVSAPADPGNSQTLSLTATTLDAPATTTSNTAPARLFAAASVTPAYQINTAEFANRTFLPYATLADDPHASDKLIVSSCVALWKALHPGVLQLPSHDYTFIGDGRTYTQPDSSDPTTEPYRTSMTVRADWANMTIGGVSDVGMTRLLVAATGEDVVDKRADTSGMTYTNKVINNDYAAITLNEAAHDPFCPALGPIGAISNRLRVEFYRSGLTVVNGFRATMPAYEGWARWNDETNWTNLYGLSAGTLACLVIGGIGEIPANPVVPGPCLGPIQYSAHRPLNLPSSVAIDTFYSTSGNTSGRDLDVERNGLFNPQKVPITQEVNSHHASGLTNPRAWIGGRPVPIAFDSDNTSLYWATPDESGTPYFEINWSGLVIGDNSNATLRSFLNSGTFTFEVQGQTGTNTVVMDLSAQLGTKYFPASNDGTGSGGSGGVAPATSYVFQSYAQSWSPLYLDWVKPHGTRTSVDLSPITQVRTWQQDPGADYNGKYYFVGRTDSGGPGLWAADLSGVTQITDPSDWFDIHQLTAWNGKLYFSGSSSNTGHSGLYVYDGVNITLIPNSDGITTPGMNYSSYTPVNGGIGFVPFHSKLYMLRQTASDTTPQLWSFDGTNLAQVATLFYGHVENGSYSMYPYVAGDTLYVVGPSAAQANGQAADWGLFAYTGTGTPTNILDIGSPFTAQPFIDGGKAYLADNDGLVEVNGTTITQVLLNGQSVNNSASYRGTLGGKLIFENWDNDTSRDAIWSWTNGDASATLVQELPANSYVNQMMGTAGGKLYLDISAPATGNELWSYDGTTLGMVADIKPGSGNGLLGTQQFAIVENSVIFDATDGNGKDSVYTYDGTTLRNTGTDHVYPTALGN